MIEVSPLKYEDNKYITAVVTEKGIVRPPFDVNLARIAGRGAED